MYFNTDIEQDIDLLLNNYCIKYYNDDDIDDNLKIEISHFYHYNIKTVSSDNCGVIEKLLINEI